MILSKESLEMPTEQGFKMNDTLKSLIIGAKCGAVAPLPTTALFFALSEYPMTLPQAAIISFKYATFFGIYETTKTVLNRNSNRHPGISAFYGACLGEFTSTILCTPMENITTEQNLHKKPRTLGTAINQIWKQNGMRGLFKGCASTCFCNASKGMVFYPTYEILKHKVNSSEGLESLKGGDQGFLLGALAGCLASLVYAPLQIAQGTVSQNLFNSQPIGAKQEVKMLYRTIRTRARHGISGAYRGAFATTVPPSMLGSAILMGTYEATKNFLFLDNNI